MQPSAQKKPSPRMNPFLRVNASAFVRQRSHLPDADPGGPQFTKLPDKPPGMGFPAKRPASFQQSVKVLLNGVLVALVVFVLLPTAMQQSVFKALGLRPFHPFPTQATVPLPVDYTYVSSAFGQRWGRAHLGIDLAARSGTPIHAVSAGRVVYSGWQPGYGQSILIDHGGGFQTRYAHCLKLLAPLGQVVQKGQPIAQVGSTGHSTGPHLHFEVLVKGVHKNPAWYYKF